MSADAANAPIVTGAVSDEALPGSWRGLTAECTTSIRTST